MNYTSPYTLSIKIERDEATADEYYNLAFCTQMVLSCAESLDMFTPKDMRILNDSKKYTKLATRLMKIVRCEVKTQTELLHILKTWPGGVYYFTTAQIKKGYKDGFIAVHKPTDVLLFMGGMVFSVDKQIITTQEWVKNELYRSGEVSNGSR